MYIRLVKKLTQTPLYNVIYGHYDAAIAHSAEIAPGVASQFESFPISTQQNVTKDSSTQPNRNDSTSSSNLSKKFR